MKTKLLWMWYSAGRSKDQVIAINEGGSGRGFVGKTNCRQKHAVAYIHLSHDSAICKPEFILLLMQTQLIHMRVHSIRSKQIMCASNHNKKKKIKFAISYRWLLSVFCLTIKFLSSTYYYHSCVPARACASVLMIAHALMYASGMFISI